MPRCHRRSLPTVAAAVLVPGLIAAGCSSGTGSGSPTKARSSAPPASSSHVSTPDPVTSANTSAAPAPVANPQAALTIAADLPTGWTAAAAPTDASRDTEDKTFDACLGRPFVRPAQRLFASFSQPGGNQVNSEVDVYGSAAQAAVAGAGSDTQKWRDCQAAAVRRGLAGSTVTLVSVTEAPLSVPGSLPGVRVTATLRANGTDVPVYLDALAFTNGTYLAMTSVALVGVAPTAAFEAKILAGQRGRAGLS